MKWTYRKILFLTPVFFIIFWQAARFMGNYYNFINMEFWQMMGSLLSTVPLDIVTFVLFYSYFAPKFFRKEQILINISISVVYIVIWATVWVLYFNYVNKQTHITNQVFLFRV